MARDPREEANPHNGKGQKNPNPTDRGQGVPSTIPPNSALKGMSKPTLLKIGTIDKR